MSLEKAMYELSRESRELNEELNKTSEQIRMTENSLRDMKVTLPFEVQLEREGEKLIWEFNEKCKNYRLVFQGQEARKPLIEFNSKTRVRISSFLEGFILAFTHHIATKKMQLIEVGYELNDTINRLEE